YLTSSNVVQTLGNGWVKVKVPMSVLDPGGKSFAVIDIENARNKTIRPVNVANVRLTNVASATQTQTSTPGSGVASTELTGTTAIKGLSRIASRQSGAALSGNLWLSAAGDLTIKATVGSKRRTIASFARSGVKAGPVSFR